MSTYRRWFVPGGTYFFTVVTYNRYPFFKETSAVDMLRDSWLKTQANLMFTNIASVVLPDHFHCLWSLPPNDDDFSKRLKSIKDRFTTTWLAAGGHEVGDRIGSIPRISRNLATSLLGACHSR